MRAAHMHTEAGQAKEAALLLTMVKIVMLLPNLWSKVVMVWRWSLTWVLRRESSARRGDGERVHYRFHRWCGELARAVARGGAVATTA